MRTFHCTNGQHLTASSWMESLCSNYMKRQFPYIVLNTDVPPPAVTSLFVFLHHASYSCATVHAGGHSRLRDLAWLVNSWWTVAKLLIINVRRKRISCTSHLQHHWIQQGYLYRTKAKVICVYFLRIKLVVKLVFEVKSAVAFLSPYIYGLPFWLKFTNHAKSHMREWPPWMVCSAR